MRRAPHSSTTSRLFRALAGPALLLACTAALAREVPGYGFEAAAQEVSQLFWLAETANLCGWATRDDTDSFERFSVRFLSAHLSERNRLALVSLVTQGGYQQAVHHSAAEGAAENCSSRRWQMGWSSYQAAAHAHESEFVEGAQ